MLIPLLDEQLGYYRPALFVLFGGVGLLLLIGVLNVASLLLTRALSREREIAVRIAVGASPQQLATQLVAESLVLSLGGAVIGITGAAAALPLIVAFSPVQIPRLEEAALSWNALGLGLGVVVVTTVFFSLVPAFLLLRSGRLTTDLKAGERGSSRGARRLYSVLVVSEVALACALLVSSALLVRTVQGRLETPLGVSADRVLTTTVQLTRTAVPAAEARASWRGVSDTHARIMEAIREQPGVVSAGGSNFLPLEIGWRGPFGVQGQPLPSDPDDLPQAQLHSVSEGYFETMGAEMAAGRAFTARDNADGVGVVIVNEAFARRHLPRGPSVGQVVRLWSTGIGPLGLNLVAAAPSTGHQGLPYEVVGIVKDIRNVPLGQTVEPAIYTPTRQFPFTDLFLAVKATDTATAVAAVREALRTTAPEVPMGRSETWGERFAARTAEPRLLMAVLLAFGALAGFLAALGVYGLFSWSVATRTRELAIRLTLGAKPSGVGGLVVRQGVLLIMAGLVAGVTIVRFAEGVLTRVLYEVSPTDVGSTAAAGGLLLVAALAACVPPAIRAMHVDPVEGLRAD